MVQAVQQELTLEQVNKAIEAILNVLDVPEPGNDLHAKALSAFVNGDYQTVKRLASTNLSDCYVKALGYLGGALKLTPNTDTILAESARAAADFARERTLCKLGDALAKALS
ncbi:MAG: hypothetical protein V7L04_18250 [Nostoc sp.]|uniref:hypothetical protein n=1 Tax=Nostoc sp. TaxID=1180 RepID=UPI002FF60DC6